MHPKHTTPCSVEGCDRTATIKGMCEMHRTRVRKYDDPHYVTPPGKYWRPGPSQRFWAMVDRSAGPDDCWPWTASRKDNGYGQFNAGGKNYQAHRYAYADAIGPIPPGMEVDHVKDRGCTMRHCCNPAHMELVTRRENIARSDGISARHARQTHCKNGHPFDEANTYVWRTARRCRTCHNERRRKSVA